HPLRQPGGVPVHLHGHDGDHGRGWGQRHPGRSRRGRSRVHDPARSAPRGRVLAVADADLRRPARAVDLLPAPRHRARPGRVARATSPVSLAVRGLAVHFGGVAALDGVSFAVHPGTITSLIGPNGAGKTTAFNAITGYLKPQRGRVTYEDTVLTGLRPCEIAR